MAKQSVNRLKLNPPLGRLPVLQFIPPAELAIDDSYQRSIDASASKTLIQRIAQHWNWDLCQPLVVSRRGGGEALFVIDGQHRLAAARLRGDIGQLPCVVVDYANPADEAASFVTLNQQRKPLSKLDLFRAAVASEDDEACGILEAIEDAGLHLATHTNWSAWQPDTVSNIGGIESCWRVNGPEVTRTALRALALAFKGQVLRYAGTIFPGIAAVCDDEMSDGEAMPERRFERLQTVLVERSQEEWRSEVLRVRADQPGLRFAETSALAFRRQWRGTAQPRESEARPAPVATRSASLSPKPAVKQDLFGTSGKGWCEQCEQLVSQGRAAGCRDTHCKMKAAA